jgi:protein-L-isoaspartate(D-aspartate) O-methyltransferase
MLVSAAAPDVPQVLLDQLAPKGRLLIPIGSRSEQTLTLFEKTDEGFRREDITACTFVPLLGRFGWDS